MRWELAPGVFCLVPSARLELAQLSPLPPQDSVSTNFTTSAIGSFYLNSTGRPKDAVESGCIHVSLLDRGYITSIRPAWVLRHPT